MRESLHKTDCGGIEERIRRRLHRRVYNVVAPNHLWHIDTIHKLIRWHLVIAGRIDGFSRFVVFLQCTSDNKANTILKCFMGGVKDYGTPLRVRSDQGMKNYRVAEYMPQARGANRSSMITGKAPTISELNGYENVYEGVVFFYYDLYHFMEDEGILDPLNEIHLFSLYFVYLEKINQKLEVLRNAWAMHRLRTARSSPMRLFLAGSINTPVDIPLGAEEEVNYGVDGNSNGVQEQNARPVLNPISFEINATCRSQLETHCPKDWISQHFDIDIYIKAVEIIKRYNE